MYYLIIRRLVVITAQMSPWQGFDVRYYTGAVKGTEEIEPFLACIPYFLSAGCDIKPLNPTIRLLREQLPSHPHNLLTASSSPGISGNFSDPSVWREI